MELVLDGEEGDGDVDDADDNDPDLPDSGGGDRTDWDGGPSGGRRDTRPDTRGRWGEHDAGGDSGPARRRGRKRNRRQDQSGRRKTCGPCECVGTPAFRLTTPCRTLATQAAHARLVVPPRGDGRKARNCLHLLASAVGAAGARSNTETSLPWQANGTPGSTGSAPPGGAPMRGEDDTNRRPSLRRSAVPSRARCHGTLDTTWRGTGTRCVLGLTLGRLASRFPP